MKNRIVVVCLLILSCGFAACDLFSTRVPEPPGSATTFIWTPATSPEALIADFTGALSALDPSNYVRVFVSATDSTGSAPKSFTFTPIADLDPSSRAVFGSWSPDAERSWLTKLGTLVAKNSKLTVALAPATPIQSSSTAATFTTSYVISIPVTSGALIPDTVRGSLDMQFVLVTTEQGTKEWRILSWSDFATSGNSVTWTDLKLKLSS